MGQTASINGMEMYYFPETARAFMRAMTIDSRTEEDWHMMRERHRHGDDQIRALWTQANAFRASYDDVSFTPAELSTISARTLIVHGDRDPLYPVDVPLEMQGRDSPRATVDHPWWRAQPDLRRPGRAVSRSGARLLQRRRRQESEGRDPVKSPPK